MIFKLDTKRGGKGNEREELAMMEESDKSKINGIFLISPSTNLLMMRFLFYLLLL